MQNSDTPNRIPSWLLRVYYPVRASFWFWPSIYFFLAFLAAFLTIRFDQSELATRVAKWLPGGPISVEGARGVLTTIAGSTITVASLVFSLTFVALTLMSQQFGPRILLILMKDRMTQFVIGIFIAAFIFSLLILAAIESSDAGLFVPQITVYTAILLALLAFASVIFFIHHIAQSIQADSVVAQLGADLDDAIDSALLADPDGSSEDPDREDAIERPEDENSVPINLKDSGYVQLIDFDDALALMEEENCRLRYFCRPGHFVVAGRPVACLQHLNNSKSDHEDDLKAAVAATIHLGAKRTPAHQAEYELNALVEVALRALSPGINDPFTAIGCVNQLTDALMRLVKGKIRSAVILDGNGDPRVFKHPQSFSHFLNSAFHPIRQSSRGNPQMLLHLTQALETLAQAADDDARKEALREHAEILLEDCKSSIRNTTDRARVCGQLKRLCDLLA